MRSHGASAVNENGRRQSFIDPLFSFLAFHCSTSEYKSGADQRTNDSPQGWLGHARVQSFR